MRSWGSDRRFLPGGLVFACLLAAWLAAGCGSTGKQAPVEGSLRGTELEQAQRLYAQLQREQMLQHDRKVLDLAASLLDYYPAFARNDEVLSAAVEAAARTGDRRRALDLTRELLGRYPDSPFIDPALERGVQVAAAAGDTLAAADFAVRFHDRDPARGLRADGTPRAAPWLEPLTVAELDGLLRDHPRTALDTYIRYLQVQRHMAAGRYGEAQETADLLVAAAPDNRWTVAAVAAAGGQRAALAPARRAGGPVQLDLVGVLCPLTGRYAVLGNAYYEGALLAVTDANAELGREFRLHAEDSAGDPVVAALAMRRLCGDLGVMAVLGSLMSDPTAAAALVADNWGVPLVSPTATNDRIWELGPAIFQTNLTGLYEVRLLAQLASQVMLKSTFGILHPDDPEGRRHADVFRNEIEALGGRIVAEAAFAPQGTDFRAPILSLRARRPEVLFVPASVDQMILLGPQLDFYHAGSMIMGLSNWNSAKLAERSETVLDRAVFPDDFPLFPARWSDEFEANWQSENYPPEATELALKAYQATRMLLDTLGESGAVTRAQLADALRRRLANQDFEAEGPDSFGPTVRMFLDKRIVPFPSDLYRDGWLLAEAAAAFDSLAAPSGADSVGVNAPRE